MNLNILKCLVAGAALALSACHGSNEWTVDGRIDGADGKTMVVEACDNGRISVNGRVVKAGYDVKVGDKIEISMGARTVTVEVLQVAETVRKDDASAMYKEV